MYVEVESNIWNKIQFGKSFSLNIHINWFLLERLVSHLSILKLVYLRNMIPFRADVLNFLSLPSISKSLSDVSATHLLFHSEPVSLFNCTWRLPVQQIDWASCKVGGRLVCCVVSIQRIWVWCGTVHSVQRIWVWCGTVHSACTEDLSVVCYASHNKL